MWTFVPESRRELPADVNMDTSRFLLRTKYMVMNSLGLSLLPLLLPFSGGCGNFRSGFHGAKFLNVFQIWIFF